MRIWCATLVGVLLCAGSAVAQDLEATDPCLDLEAAAADAGDPAELALEGAPGLWLPMPVARHALCVLRVRGLERRELRLDQQELELWRARVEILREQVGLAVEARGILGDVVEAASRRAREAEERADSIWRSPVLWFGAGVVATVAAALGVRALL